MINEQEIIKERLMWLDRAEREDLEQEEESSKFGILNEKLKHLEMENKRLKSNIKNITKQCLFMFVVVFVFMVIFSFVLNWESSSLERKIDEFQQQQIEWNELQMNINESSSDAISALFDGVNGILYNIQ